MDFYLIFIEHAVAERKRLDNTDISVLSTSYPLRIFLT